MQVLARGAIAAAMGALVALVMVADAAAQSSICRKLEAQLASAGSRGGSRAEGYAIRQRQELRKAQGQLRAAGCGFFSSNGQCASIRSVIGRMERNLSSLERQAGGGSRSRSQILAALNANDCRGGSTQRQMIARERDQGSLLSAFFGEPDRRRSSRREQTRIASLEDRPWVPREEPRRQPREHEEFRDRGADERKRDSDAARQSVGAVYKGDNYQTMCVRMTDGYYFPVSPASYRSDFERDRNNCQAMCPGTEVSIYYKRLDDDEMDAMISADNGRPYKSLSTAYRYREQPRVGCSGDRATAMLATQQSQAKTIDFEFPVPTPKPGSDNTIPLWVGSSELAVVTPAPAERTVRVVGPVYLPDQQSAAIPQVPDPTPAQ